RYADARHPPPTLCRYHASPEIDTLSLHDALPICRCVAARRRPKKKGSSLDKAGAESAALQLELLQIARVVPFENSEFEFLQIALDRKSTRLNSSHVKISYAVFCLKNKRAHIQKRH